ncbi:YncE family protein [Gordonia sp. VNK21]|uniref:YncE family protein n=1 Tax=Gordonia sp. VNK21 TaxID=3382483 RepID=UPI0038D478A5
MKSRLSKVRAAALTVTAAFSLGLVAAPASHAAPASPAPAVPQPAGYSIHGYNIGEGNYRGAIDAQTGDLWLTNVSPMSGATRSVIYRVNPNTMDIKQRINVTQKADTGGHGSVAAQYEIGVPKTGNTVWTTAAAANGGEANVWDKTTGRRLANIGNLPHSHSVEFIEDLRIAVISVTPGLVFFDMDTFKRLGEVKYPSGGKQLGAGVVVTDESPAGATVTSTSYYTDLTQFRVTRSGDSVQAKVKWNTRQAIDEGHGSVAADARTNRLYVNNLYQGLSVYNLRTGKHIGDVNTGPGTNSMLVFQGKLYAANYFLGFISVIDQKTLGVTQLMTTGLLPNQLLGWKKNTFLVIDKASSISELPSGLLGYPLPPVGGDHIYKVTKH